MNQNEPSFAAQEQELAQLRSQLREFERMYGDVNQITYTIVHQLKRSLSLILGFSDRLRETWATLPPEEVAKYLRIISQAGREMNDAVDELLLQVHVRDEQRLQSVPLAMDAVIAEALERLHYVIERKAAVIDVAETWPAVWGYPLWIEELWYTFISEALWLTGDGAQLSLGGAATEHGGRFWVRVLEADPALCERFAQTQPPAQVQRILAHLGGAVERAPTGDCALIFTLASGQHDYRVAQ